MEVIDAMRTMRDVLAAEFRCAEIEDDVDACVERLLDGPLTWRHVRQSIERGADARAIHTAIAVCEPMLAEMGMRAIGARMRSDCGRTSWFHQGWEVSEMAAREVACRTRLGDHETEAHFRARVKAETGVELDAIPDGMASDPYVGRLVARRGDVAVHTWGYGDRDVCAQCDSLAPHADCSVRPACYGEREFYRVVSYA